MLNSCSNLSSTQHGGLKVGVAVGVGVGAGAGTLLGFPGNTLG